MDTTPLRLDVENEEFRVGEERIRLGRKPFKMLRLLVERRPDWVSKDDFYRAIWKPKDEEVLDWTFSTYVYEIRKALGDETRPYRYIETKVKKGYRFIGPFTENDQLHRISQTRSDKAQPAYHPHHFTLPPNPQPPLPYVVGREAELGQLHNWLDRVLAGERQCVFVTGAPGIGKTTLVRTFLREVATSGSAVIGRGQCIEQYGPGEAYLPVLEALGRLGRDPHASAFLQWMKRHTPTWLLQMPTLLTPAELEDVRRAAHGITRERMLREMSEAIEVLTEQIPFILVLEDLHWSDVSTLELLSSLARRTEPARLLILGTYRPGEGLAAGHPLRGIIQELQGHRQCEELALSPFNETAVRAYLQQRFPTATLPTPLPKLLYRNTEGIPLFLTAVVNELIERKVISQDDGTWVFREDVPTITTAVPVSIRQLLTRQIDRLSERERQIVQVASVAGHEFSTAAVAAAVKIDIAEVEAYCDALAQRQHFLRRLGYSEWPDGVRSARYSFRHAVYQYLWNERIPVGQRQQFHLRIGERLEHGYGSRVSEIAAELAVHFEEGRDYDRAVKYMQLAARNALRRSAYAEAANLLAKGITLLKTLPETPERLQQELMLQLARGGPLIATKGYGAPEVEAAYVRAFALCQQPQESSYLLQAQQGLAAVYSIRGQFQKARQLGEQCLALAQQLADPSRLLQAEWTLGQALFHIGDFVAARQHVERALALYDPLQHRSRAVQDLGVTSHSYLAWGLWFLGYPDQALAMTLKALTLAQGLSHSFSEAFALIFAAGIYRFRGDGRKTQEVAEKAIALCQEQEFPVWLAFGVIVRGWALAGQGRAEEGIEQIRKGLADWEATGAEASRPLVLAMLAEAYGSVGRVAEGLVALEEAFVTVQENEERYYEAELHRLKGELLLLQEQFPVDKSPRSKVQGPKSKVQDRPESRVQSPKLRTPHSALRTPHLEAEACFLKAIALARHQHMKSLELRAVLSVSRLWKHYGKSKEARHLLAETYDWFTEGFETADLKAAKSLLVQLAKESVERISKSKRRA